MALNKVTRGEKILQGLVDEHKLTAHGRDFVIAGLDPMHDTPLQNLSGWPDIADQPSVIRTIKRSVNVVAPIGQTGNWDCVIRTLPILNETSVCATDRRQNVLTAQPSGADIPIGPVTICQYWNPAQAWGLESLDSDPIVVALPDEVAKGNGRLISMGFEVNNTTAELYKQGTTTVWRSPQQQAEEHTWYGSMIASGGGAALTAVTGRDVAWGPANLSDAMLLAGSRQWEAKDGAYCVVPFISAENPVQPPGYVQPIMRPGADDYDFNFRGITNTPVYLPFLTSQADASRTFLLPGLQKWAPVHSAGAAFTGLSKETTLTVTVNFFYEYFPSSKDVSLVTLAKPSGSYDPVALELYSIALSELPVGVPAYMNGFGDWFASVVSKFAPTVGTLLSPLIGPGGAIAGNGAKIIADSYLAASSPFTKPRLQASQKQKKKNPQKKEQVDKQNKTAQTSKPNRKRK